MIETERMKVKFYHFPNHFNNNQLNHYIDYNYYLTYHCGNFTPKMTFEVKIRRKGRE